MSEVHTKITINSSGNQIVFENPAQPPLAVGAGQPVVATVKPAGQPNGSVSGQVAGTSVIVRNPA